MNTKNFTLFDRFLSKYRLSVVTKYVEKGDVILDIGCGVQHYLLTNFKHKFKLGYGLDYDIVNQQNENLVLLNYRYQGNLPLKDDFFDKVFLLAVLEHIEIKDVVALFLEFSRILKKNGRVIITTPTLQCKPILEFIAFKFKLVADNVSDHKHYYIPNEIYDLARSSGLKVNNFKLFQLGLNSLYVLEKLHEPNFSK